MTSDGGKSVARSTARHYGTSSYYWYLETKRYLGFFLPADFAENLAAGTFWHKSSTCQISGSTDFNFSVSMQLKIVDLKKVMVQTYVRPYVRISTCLRTDGLFFVTIAPTAQKTVTIAKDPEPTVGSP